MKQGEAFFLIELLWVTLVVSTLLLACLFPLLFSIPNLGVPSDRTQALSIAENRLALIQASPWPHQDPCSSSVSHPLCQTPEGFSVEIRDQEFQPAGLMTRRIDVIVKGRSEAHLQSWWVEDD